MKTQTMEWIAAGKRQRQQRWLMITGSLVLLAILLCGAMLLLGHTIYPVFDVIRVLLGEQIQGATFAIQTIRLPRMLSGLFAGFAFGIAGNTFQTMLRNPLANPNVIGITTGSSAAAVFCIIILQASNTIVSIASVAGGLITVLLLYIFSRTKRSSFSIGRLILVGIGIQAMLNAVISYLLLVGGEQDIPAALRWLSGSLNGIRVEDVTPLIMAVLICAPIVVLFGKHLSILELGEQTATTLGVHTDQARMALILSSVCMIALATAVTGPIAFVAFLAGPIAKRLVGVGFSNAIPAGLVGVNLVLGADLMGQFAFEVRYPVGIITGMIGAPYLIYLLIRMNQKGDL
ncbi:iron chelate uptake ABC transporter family permease subunit [Halobacillus rhizosphaerae]|uniref:FecCD family ABC transporter permease n=1 Tax=Halobacillus rhizosphaerae TaxID=3064889 RepID=UPI00398B0221